MKKIKFLVNTHDKYTKEEYAKGQEKEFEDARADEILKAKKANGQAYAELVEEIIETATKKAKTETAVKKTRKKKENDV